MFFPFFFDFSIILLIPAVIFAGWAQLKVKSSFAKYSKVRAGRGVTARQVARLLLDSYGLQRIPVRQVGGQLTDNYNPREKTLNLSENVYNSSSIAAIGVAAHETGHAIQDLKNYAPMRIRNAIVPVANLGSGLAFPLFFIGLLFQASGLMTLGILVFVAVLLFHLVTLPVELDASSRALRILDNRSVLSSEELRGARAVLNAAALTYVAATVMAAAQLVRLLVLRNMFGGDE
ncbi:MAG: zinc metallopeptidase [Synergistales bacterium]|nr:zinc metallopeptidase [Synergistales bacterium]